VRDLPKEKSKGNIPYSFCSLESLADAVTPQCDPEDRDWSKGEKCTYCSSNALICGPPEMANSAISQQVVETVMIENPRPNYWLSQIFRDCNFKPDSLFWNNDFQLGQQFLDHCGHDHSSSLSDHSSYLSIIKLINNMSDEEIQQFLDRLRGHDYSGVLSSIKLINDMPDQETQQTTTETIDNPKSQELMAKLGPVYKLDSTSWLPTTLAKSIHSAEASSTYSDMKRIAHLDDTRSIAVASELSNISKSTRESWKVDYQLALQHPKPDASVDDEKVNEMIDGFWASG
jgi:hypothetical protein